MERSMALLLGLTGNWGKKGTGTRSWAIMGYDGDAFLADKERPGQEAAQKYIAGMIAMRRLVAAQDPTLTTEMMQNRVAQMAAELGGMGFPMPPAFMWYHQFGYKERWNDPENNDPSMKRSFDAYVQEATEKGWWNPRFAKTFQEVEPRVIFESGGNMLRRQRGGQKLLLEHLWPKLKLFITCDYRITTTGLFSDYILPAAQHYEKLGYSMPSVHHLNYVLCDRAVPPQGESLPDIEIGFRILEKIEERAEARGMKEFIDVGGKKHALTGMLDRITHGGVLRDEETRFDEIIRDNVVYGVLPEGSDLKKLREKGAVRYTGWGMVGHGQSQASTIRPDEVHNPLRWHTEDKVPYDTLVRRAQYYIDHEWFLEAGEELPTHKLPDDQRPQPLEHPLDEPDQQHHPEHPPRRAVRLHQRCGREGSRDRERREGEAGEQRRRVAGAGQDLGVGAAGPGDPVQRLRALHARELVQPVGSGVGPREAPGLRCRLRPPQLPAAFVAADPGGSRGARGRAEGELGAPAGATPRHFRAA
jgi:anaerobic selenocysteine-containing dehydrogenase